MKIVIPHKG